MQYISIILTLVATDDVQMVYEMLNDTMGVADAIETNRDMFVKVLRGPVESSVKSGKGQLISEEEQEVQGATFLLRLLSL